MIKERNNLLRQSLVIVDIAVITLSFFLAYQLRAFMEVSPSFSHYELKPVMSLESYQGLMPVIIFPWAFALYVAGAYQPFRQRDIQEMIRSVLIATFVALIIFSSIAFLLKLHFVSRLLIALIFIIAGTLLTLERVSVALILHVLRRKGFSTRYMLIVGSGDRAKKFIEQVHKHPEWGFKIIGIIDDEKELVGNTLMGHKILGTLDYIPQLFEQTVVDEVVFVVPRSWLERIEGAILYCEELGKSVNVAIDLYTLHIADARQTSFHGIPTLTFQSTPTKIGQLVIKRLLDILLSISALILLSPFFLFIMILIRTSSPGPAFFKQVRSGLNGREFTLYKFRTMTLDAEEQLEELRQKNEMEGPVFKLEEDPRLIKHGKWIRKFSIDEFPQFFNVLVGDMSIVGPRPPIPAEVKKYAPWQLRRLSMRPGLTCIWQVEGRNRITDFDEWMELDLKYIDHWSLWLDLKLFLQTIPVVVFGIGAK